MLIFNVLGLIFIFRPQKCVGTLRNVKNCFYAPFIRLISENWIKNWTKIQFSQLLTTKSSIIILTLQIITHEAMSFVCHQGHSSNMNSFEQIKGEKVNCFGFRLYIQSVKHYYYKYKL